MQTEAFCLAAKPVCLNLSAESPFKVFFSHNKSASSTFSHSFSDKRLGSRTDSLSFAGQGYVVSAK
jgi:hypothetical protein